MFLNELQKLKADNEAEKWKEKEETKPPDIQEHHKQKELPKMEQKEVDGLMWKLETQFPDAKKTKSTIGKI